MVGAVTEVPRGCGGVVRAARAVFDGEVPGGFKNVTNNTKSKSLEESPRALETGDAARVGIHPEGLPSGSRGGSF